MTKHEKKHLIATQIGLFWQSFQIRSEWIEHGHFIVYIPNRLYKLQMNQVDIHDKIHEIGKRNYVEPKPKTFVSRRTKTIFTRCVENDIIFMGGIVGVNGLRIAQVKWVKVDEKGPYMAPWNKIIKINDYITS